MTKPTIIEIKNLCPQVEEAFVDAHIQRLPDEYFERFSLDEIAMHVARLSRICHEHPVDLVARRHETGEMECTVLAFDYPFEFSLLTGTLSSMGFNIESGDIFTYERNPDVNPKPSLSKTRRAACDKTSGLRRIIDRFSGSRDSSLPFEAWIIELQRRLETIFRLLEEQRPDSLQRAKQTVNEWVTERLASLPPSPLPVLYPVQVEIANRSARHTELKVEGQDTPAFLYSLSTALSLHGVSIESVRIRTIHRRIEDVIAFTDLKGAPVTDNNALNQIKLSVLLTKQFTYFLNRAPDPFAALSRFEQLIQDAARLPESGRWMETLSNPRAMQDLARLLGTSDFLWEDFIRLQYESLLPVLEPHVRRQAILQPPETLPERLKAAVRGATDFEEKKARLNAFKDRELFLIDLDHILSEQQDFRLLAERLTALAECIVREASSIVYEHLCRRYGTPRTVAGIEVPYAIFGLGKFGGAAMGYASDIELLFVFSDHGNTDGNEPLDNSEFFGLLARETARFIAAKREGIFHVDLRLRPHGNAGSLACSLESFCRYYGPDGEAHSYERLALVRLRAVAGDPALGQQVERLRDEFVYETPKAIRLEDLRQLRQRQIVEKMRPGAYNAKFSPGALVDVEYTVQVLQVLSARDLPDLRTPRIHEALDQLKRSGILTENEHDALVSAYDFLRRLINGLRMLRGSAKDLYLPPTDSEEFAHLARRMGYARGPALTPEQQLLVDFETHTASVRTFVEQRFGRQSLPTEDVGNVADLLLSKSPSARMAERVLKKLGFQNIRRALTNLQNMAQPEEVRADFIRLAVLGCDMLRREPDADMALNNWERFVGALERRLLHYQQMLAQPKRLELLLSIFSRSQYLADHLIRHPSWLEWVTDPQVVLHAPSRAETAQRLRDSLSGAPTRNDWMLRFNRFRQKELLRIGTRDICLRVNTRDVMADITYMAEAMVEAALQRAREEVGADPRYSSILHSNGLRFGILAFGKLGGEELNYSSDIDLLAVYERADVSPEEAFSAASAIMEKTRHFLTAHTDEGHAFRVDLRLRPYGRAGELVHSTQALVKYYRQEAAFWEIQALLKLRPIAGDTDVGGRLLEQLRPILLQEKQHETVGPYIRKLREIATGQGSPARRSHTDVKTGIGGIRDIEFLAQGLQLVHACRRPEILQVSTLNSLLALANVGILPCPVADTLCEDYIFLRRVEHYLQILEDRQIHTIPTDSQELEALARRVYGPQATGDSFAADLQKRLGRVREAFLKHLPE
jgi:glutamate-ammonia-ligase adenylyltransferase